MAWNLAPPELNLDVFQACNGNDMNNVMLVSRRSYKLIMKHRNILPRTIINGETIISTNGDLIKVRGNRIHTHDVETPKMMRHLINNLYYFESLTFCQQTEDGNFSIEIIF